MVKKSLQVSQVDLLTGTSTVTNHAVVTYLFRIKSNRRLKQTNWMWLTTTSHNTALCKSESIVACVLKELLLW